METSVNFPKQLHKQKMEKFSIQIHPLSDG